MLELRLGVRVTDQSLEFAWKCQSRRCIYSNYINVGGSTPAMDCHSARHVEPLPRPFLIEENVDEAGGREQPVAHGREIVAQPDQVAHHDELVRLLVPLLRENGGATE